MRRTDAANPHINILGIRVDNVTYEDTLRRVGEFVCDGTPRQIATVNPEFIIIAQDDAEFRDILGKTALNIPDGIGLLWAARVLGKPLQERVAGVDTTERIAELAAQRGYRLFLLGAQEGVAAKVAQIWRARYPEINIAGVYAGSPAAEEETEIVEMIRAAAPDILFVAYGCPKQDKWIARNQMKIGVPVALGIGGAFDFISGSAVRAPVWVQSLGLEWLHRLYREPWRWRRMLRLPRFMWLVLMRRVSAPIKGTPVL